VLFSDLRGFTTLSESLLPEELTRILNGYFSAMTPAVLEEHGTIDKFIGDAIMAFWNAPLSVKDHSTRAVHAALKMQIALDEFNKVHNTTLKMGVGLHRGDVIVGNVGSQDRINYTILGDTVNLGSRVEGLTKKYGVVCIATEAVKNVVHDKTILFRKLDVITVKGKAEHTLLYEAMYRTKEKEKMCKQYEEGFELYFKGDFVKAKKIFEELAKEGDGPSEMLLERIDIVEHHENWDGVWHFDEK
jgi:adenylate cyclase